MNRSSRWRWHTHTHTWFSVSSSSWIQFSRLRTDVVPTHTYTHTHKRKRKKKPKIISIILLLAIVGVRFRTPWLPREYIISIVYILLPHNPLYSLQCSECLLILTLVRGESFSRPPSLLTTTRSKYLALNRTGSVLGSCVELSPVVHKIHSYRSLFGIRNVLLICNRSRNASVLRRQTRWSRLRRFAAALFVILCIRGVSCVFSSDTFTFQLVISIIAVVYPLVRYVDNNKTHRDVIRTPNAIYNEKWYKRSRRHVDDVCPPLARIVYHIFIKTVNANDASVPIARRRTIYIYIY